MSGGRRCEKRSFESTRRVDGDNNDDDNNADELERSVVVDDNDNRDDEDDGGDDEDRDGDSNEDSGDDDDEDGDTDDEMPPTKRAVGSKNIVCTIIDRLPVSDFYVNGRPSFELQPDAVIETYIAELNWSDYVSLASKTTIGIQRFLGADPGAMGRDAGVTLADHLLYPFGIQLFLRRDYGISYAPNECSARRTFERRMVAQSLALYAPRAGSIDPATGAIVTKREQLVKLRRLYTWLHSLASATTKAELDACLICRDDEERVYFSDDGIIPVEQLGNGLVLIMLGYNFIRHLDAGYTNALPNSNYTRFALVASTELFRLRIGQIDNRELARTALAFLLPRQWGFAHGNRIDSKSLLTLLYDDSGASRDYLPPDIAFDSGQIYRLSMAKYAIYAALFADDKLYVRYDTNSAYSGGGAMLFQHVHTTATRREVPILADDSGVLNCYAPRFLWGPLVIGQLKVGADRGDYVILNLDPNTPSFRIEMDDDVQPFTPSQSTLSSTQFYDEHGELCLRLVVTRRCRLSSGDHCYENALTRVMLVIDIAVLVFAGNGQHRSTRQFTWAVQERGVATSLLRPVQEQDKFLVVDNIYVGQPETRVFKAVPRGAYALVLDPETGVAAFYPVAENASERLPILANNLANAPEQPPNWQSYFFGTLAPQEAAPSPRT